jgi:polysaccharide export outer membrane protein
MSRARVEWLGLCLFAGAAAGCAHEQRLPSAEAAASEYRIGREDLLDVAIWRDPDLSRVVPVRPDGNISLPLVGELRAAGKTAAVLAEEIAGKLGPYVQEPRVAVMVREVNAPRFFVIGEVPHPGGFPLRGRTTVLQALALAGGPNEFAHRGGIVILRGGEARDRFQIDYDTLVNDQTKDFALAPGDTVVVP